jgi:pantetheine-phosphate adenylyltransferase
MFDKLIVAVTTHPEKKPLFSLKERLDMVKAGTKGMKGIEVMHFDSLLVDFARERGATIIVRGLREVSDFENEFKLATVNRKLNQNIDTVLIVTGEKYYYLSSGLVREIAGYGGNLKEMVPKQAEENLRKKFKALK